MKTIMCKDLGGPTGCEHLVSGETFEALGTQCQAHVKEQITAGDAAHTEAVERMRNASVEEQQKMFAAYKQKWDETPEV